MPRKIGEEGETPAVQYETFGAGIPEKPIWFNAPEPLPGMDAHTRAANLWDFLMRNAFAGKIHNPEPYVKQLLLEYFTLQMGGR